MGNEFKSLKLSDVLNFATEKIDVERINIEDYISTENLIPDFGGVNLASTIPKCGKVTIFYEGDILFSNIRTYFKKLWYANRAGACSNDVIVFRSKQGLNPRFAFYSLMHEEFIEHTVKTSKGTKMPRGDKDAIAKYLISVPDVKTQSTIAHILSQFS